MLNITVATNHDAMMAALSETARKQVPFASALALTTTAAEAMKAVRDEAEDTFTLRNRYTLRGIQTNRAEKRDWPNQKAEVGIEKGRDYLIDHALGGKRRGHITHGRAIPVNVRRLKSGKISKPQRPGRLLAKKGRKQPFVIQGKHTRNGRDLIAVRTTARRYPVKILYAFQKGVNIRKEFMFEQEAEKRVGKVYNREFGRALAKAIATGKAKKANGTRGGGFKRVSGRYL